MRWVLVDEVTATFKLLPVNVNAELQVHDSPALLAFLNIRVAYIVDDALPGRESRAHGRAYQQHRSLFLKLPHGTVPHDLAIEVP